MAGQGTMANGAWQRAVCTCLLLGSMTGCAVARQDFVQLNAGTSFPPRDIEAPVVLSVGDLDRAYQEIGVIHVSGMWRQGYERLNKRMRANARQVGADAIIFVHYGTENVLSIIPFFVALPYDVLTADGLAVRSLDAPSPAVPEPEPSPQTAP